MNRNPEKKRRVGLFLEKYATTRSSCSICPHGCAVNRNQKGGRDDDVLSSRQLGRCGEPWGPRVSSANLHHGEEPPVSGLNGSGTVFFTGCNMHCAYCQNFPISQLRQGGREIPAPELAGILLSLQDRGAHNINFVTPSHYVFQVVETLGLALDRGLVVPVVYNTSGYDRPDVIRDLDGIVDLWLPDAKYADPALSEKYSGVENYFGFDAPCLLEMFRQTGPDLDLDENGIARKGMIIRHLVLPGHTDNSRAVLKWIRDNLSASVHLSVMAQYFPAHRVGPSCLPELNRRVSAAEYDEVLDYAESLGFENAWFQEYER